jgi:hypothetical protein
MAQYPLLDVDSEQAVAYLKRKVQVYPQARTKRASDGKVWDWRRLAPNGRKVATSGTQGYSTRAGAWAAAVVENPGLAIEEAEA